MNKDTAIRRDAIRNIRENDHVAAVVMDGYAKTTGNGSLDDHWDQDGDSIEANYRDRFWADGHPVVEVAFAQGTDPQMVARMLKKMATMLEGRHGQQIVNMGLLQNQTDYARWLGNGEVRVANFFKEYQRWQQQDEQQDEDNTSTGGAA